MLHGVLHLLLDEFVVALCVGRLCLELLHLALLAFEDGVEHEGFALEPLDGLLQARDGVVVADLASGLDGLVPEEEQLFLNFGHVSLKELE